MNKTPEILALVHAHDTCLGHAEALREALADLHLRSLQEQDASWAQRSLLFSSSRAERSGDPGSLHDFAGYSGSQ